MSAAGAGSGSLDIWQSLLAFNVGVEIGQLTIIVIAWPLFSLHPLMA